VQAPSLGRPGHPAARWSTRRPPPPRCAAGRRRWHLGADVLQPHPDHGCLVGFHEHGQGDGAWPEGMAKLGGRRVGVALHARHRLQRRDRLVCSSSALSEAPGSSAAWASTLPSASLARISTPVTPASRSCAPSPLASPAPPSPPDGRRTRRRRRLDRSCRYRLFLLPGSPWLHPLAPGCPTSGTLRLLSDSKRHPETLLDAARYASPPSTQPTSRHPARMTPQRSRDVITSIG
jgi:hypothetical protein